MATSTSTYHINFDGERKDAITTEVKDFNMYRNLPFVALDIELPDLSIEFFLSRDENTLTMMYNVLMQAADGLDQILEDMKS